MARPARWWFRQLVHHDVWDYDLPAQPTLTTITYQGKTYEAVVVVTKTGMLFGGLIEQLARLFIQLKKDLCHKPMCPVRSLAHPQPFPLFQP